MTQRPAAGSSTRWIHGSRPGMGHSNQAPCCTHSNVTFREKGPDSPRTLSMYAPFGAESRNVPSLADRTESTSQSSLKRQESGR